MKAFEFAGEVERIVDPDSLADFADGEVGRFQQLRRQRVSDGLEIVVRRNSDDLPEPPGEGVGEIPADTIRMRQPRIADDPAVRQRSFAEFRTRGKSIAEELRLLIRNPIADDSPSELRIIKEAAGAAQ